MESRRRIRALRVLVVGSSLAACATSAAPAPRVRPDFIDKRALIPLEYDSLTGASAAAASDRAALEPLFVARTEIAGSPPWVNPGAAPLDALIRWEVTEDFLLARRVPREGDASPVDEIVAAYRVQAHFDLPPPDYASREHEELSPLPEPPGLRPWYQRRYLRVDFSQNLVDGAGLASALGRAPAQTCATAIPLYTQSPGDPRAPAFRCGEASCAEASPSLDAIGLWGRALLFADVASVAGCEQAVRAPACAAREVAYQTTFTRVAP